MTDTDMLLHAAALARNDKLSWATMTGAERYVYTRRARGQLLIAEWQAHMATINADTIDPDAPAYSHEAEHGTAHTPPADATLAEAFQSDTSDDALALQAPTDTPHIALAHAA